MRRALLAAFGCLPLLVGCHDLGAIQRPRDGGSGGSGGGGSDAPVAPCPGELAVTRLDDSVVCRPIPPSCALMTSTCGNGDSCCELSREVGETTQITGTSMFSRGYDRSIAVGATVPVSQDDGMGKSVPVHGTRAKTDAPVHLHGFFLDRYEVTVGRFRRFFQGYGGNVNNIFPAPSSGSYPKEKTENGWKLAWNGNAAFYAQTGDALRTGIGGCDPNLPGWLDGQTSDHDDEPMRCVTWFEAFLFCAQDGGHLPSEAQWNYAAAGGSEYRPYPWTALGATDLLRVDLATDGNIASGSVRRVGQSKPGRWNHYDLAGNVWELVLDACAGLCDAYEDMNPNTTIIDPMTVADEAAGRESGIVRGGSFDIKYPAPYARTAYRKVYARATINPRLPDVGWRCAREL